MFVHRTLSYCIVFIFFIQLYSCEATQKKSDFPNTDMYDLSSPKVIKLPSELDEISGIAYYPKDTSVFAIIDEDGILYKISLKNPKQFRSWRFDKKRDFEDVVLSDSTFYVLVSDGDIIKVTFDNDRVISTKINLSHESKKVNEYESLFLDSGKLITLCKSCEDDPKNSVSSFSYNYADSIPLRNPFLTFNLNSVFSKKPKHLKPSAAAVNPVSGEIYIISSIESLLVITNSKGEVKSFYKLDPDIYNQPEGIAFTNNGDMVISNEAGDKGTATLLLMKNKQKK